MKISDGNQHFEVISESGMNENVLGFPFSILFCKCIFCFHLFERQREERGDRERERDTGTGKYFAQIVSLPK